MRSLILDTTRARKEEGSEPLGLEIRREQWTGALGVISRNSRQAIGHLLAGNEKILSKRDT